MNPDREGSHAGQAPPPPHKQYAPQALRHFQYAIEGRPAQLPRASPLQARSRSPVRVVAFPARLVRIAQAPQQSAAAGQNPPLQHGNTVAESPPTQTWIQSPQGPLRSIAKVAALDRYLRHRGCWLSHPAPRLAPAPTSTERSTPGYA